MTMASKCVCRCAYVYAHTFSNCTNLAITCFHANSYHFNFNMFKINNSNTNDKMRKQSMLARTACRRTEANIYNINTIYNKNKERNTKYSLIHFDKVKSNGNTKQIVYKSKIINRRKAKLETANNQPINTWQKSCQMHIHIENYIYYAIAVLCLL